MKLFRAPAQRHSRTRTAVLAATGAAALLALDVVGAAPAAAHDRSFPTMLQELRQCESGGNYGINTGNGYYGAYQFDLQTWRGVGGSGYPHQNPPNVQDEMATRLYEQRGWSPWPSCSRKHGLHATTVERPWAGAAPEGAVDVASSRDGAIVVRGWAFDRDVDHPIDVHVYVNGRGAANVRADQPRPDVQAAFGRGESSGWSAQVPASQGNNSVCVYGIGAGQGGNTLLGCRDVAGARAPIGHVDVVQQVSGGVRIAGWTLDPDTTSQPTQAHVYVDGRGAANVTADISRPDVARAYGVPEARGFDVVVPAGSQVCGFAIDTTGQADNTLLECRTPA